MDQINAEHRVHGTQLNLYNLLWRAMHFSQPQSSKMLYMCEEYNEREKNTPRNKAAISGPKPWNF